MGTIHIDGRGFRVKEEEAEAIKMIIMQFASFIVVEIINFQASAVVLSPPRDRFLLLQKRSGSNKGENLFAE